MRISIPFDHKFLPSRVVSLVAVIAITSSGWLSAQNKRSSDKSDAEAAQQAIESKSSDADTSIKLIEDGYYDQPSDYGDDDYYQFDDYKPSYDAPEVATSSQSENRGPYNDEPADYTKDYYQFDDYGPDYDKTGIWHASWYIDDYGVNNDWFFTRDWYAGNGGKLAQWLSSGDGKVSDTLTSTSLTTSGDGMVDLVGTVAGMKVVTLFDGPEHQMVKLETKDGNVIPVDLGRLQPLKQLGIREGGQISISGKRVRWNNQRVFGARKISVDGKTMVIGRERDRQLRELEGKVTNLEEKRFRDRDSRFHVAKIEALNGNAEIVILGPVSRLKQLKLQQGDALNLLVRHGQYNGKQVWVADAIHDGEQTVRLTKIDKEKFQTKPGGDES